MKKFVWIGLFLLMVFGCYSQQRSTVIINSEGIESELGQNDRVVRRNTYVSKDIFGNTVIKDDNGRTIKSIEKDIFGNIIVKDGNGHTIKSIEKDIFGNTEIKDANGHTITSIEKDIFGNLLVKDGDGHTMISIGKDIFGVFTIKDNNGNTLFNFIRENVSNKLIIRENSGNRRGDYIDEVLYFTEKDNSMDYQIIEHSMGGLRGR